MSKFFGPRQFGLEDQGWMAWFVIASLLRHPLTIYGDGKQLRDVLYVTDLVRAFDAFVTSDLPNGVFNLGGGPENTLSLVELLDMIADITGVRTGVSFDDWRPGDQRVYVSDIRQVSQALSWAPTIQPREGVECMIQWVSEHAEMLESIYG